MTRSKTNGESVKKSNNGQGATVKSNKQWVFIMKDSVLKADPNNETNQPTICKLRHPRLDSGVLFLLSADTKSICELNCFDEKYHSWFIDEAVHSGNEMYFTTPVDPLFLLMPFLISGGKNNKFQSLDQLVSDEDFPESHRLLDCCHKAQVQHVADCKDIDEDLQVYRYNKDKTMAWLKAKVDSLSDALEDKQISVSTKSSHSSMFIRSNKATDSRESYTNYAFGMISNYLSLALEAEARDSLGIKEIEEKPSLTEKVENEPPKKKQKLGEVGTPTDDYSLGVDTKKDKKNVKLTIAHKKLQKTDKTGMKSMSSFFSPKPKK